MSDCAQSIDNTGEQLLQLCKAAGDNLRLQVLRVLSRNAYSVQELCRILGVSQPGMSHHLKILAGAGLVITRREGNSIFYRRSYQALLPELDALHTQLLDSADLVDLPVDARQRLQSVVRERAKSSEAFFAEHAGRFRQQQEQIAAFELYGPSTLAMLTNSQPDGGELAVEIGPGEGAFLLELAPRYRQVIALDNADTMLERARETVSAKGYDNVRFVHGDTHSDELANSGADCVVVNMVLHHVPSPAEIFTDAASMLKNGGLLSVTELCVHDQNWVREACGDLWLGFDPDDLSQWATAAGLEEGPSDYLAQRNGFRVQVRQFFKGGVPTRPQ